MRQRERYHVQEWRSESLADWIPNINHNPNPIPKTNHNPNPIHETNPNPTTNLNSNP